MVRGLFSALTHSQFNSSLSWVVFQRLMATIPFLLGDSDWLSYPEALVRGLAVRENSCQVLRAL